MTIRAQTGPGAQTGRREHRTPLHSRRLAALTAACLLIDDARAEGLIDGGPEIDRGRCTRILAELNSDGIVAGQDEICAALIGLLAELGAVRG